MTLQLFIRSRDKLRLLSAVFATALVVGLGAAVSPAGAWDLRVCADPNYMPFSRRDGLGFDLKIAQMLGEAVGATVTHVWWPQSPSMVTERLREGACDVIMGVPETSDGLLPTIAYYRSPYVLVYRADHGLDISDFDDDALRDLRIGVQGSTDSAHLALGVRGLGRNVVMEGVARDQQNTGGPFVGLIEAVEDGSIDVATPWGPVGGYFGARFEPPLTVVPLPEFDTDLRPLFTTIVIAVRKGDEALRDLLNTAIVERWDDINAVLAEYNVPLLELPRPTLTLSGH